MAIKSKAIILLLLLIPSVSFGNSIIVGGFSKHPYNGYNENHLAIGYQLKSFEVVYFKNSHSDMSLMLSHIKVVKNKWGYRIGVANNYAKEHLSIRGYLPIIQAVYFQDNYDISFGMVTTVSFKVRT